ncbi:MAG: hypothetical protein A2Y74_04295 [Actinobacteria bacterium RBG_13_63_9]|nr:MAG: hypothetical protein A2Y74_04295 [Actinobacteria bacterium RBG_13_63_9]
MKPLLKPRYWGLLSIAVVLSLGLVGVGCEKLESTGVDVSITASPTTTAALDTTTSTEIPVSSTDTLAPTTTLPPAATTTTEKLASSETLLASGHIKAMGFIKDVWEDGSGRHLKIDYADMLTGAAADAAAVAAGAIPAGEHVDNDYWISNKSTKLRPFDISNSVAITTSTRWVPPDDVDDMNQPCTWADFLSFWGPGPFPESEGHLHEVPWWIERDGNTIVKIDEQYLP